MIDRMSRTILAATAFFGLAATSSIAAEDPVTDLANAICSAPDLNGITAALATQTADDAMSADEIAEAFGVATFLGDLGRCASRQAIADSFAFFKKGKDIARIDAAFAMGHVAAKPGGGGTATAEAYQGSFVALGTAGEAPSSQ